MLIKRIAKHSYPFELTNPQEEQEVTYMWASDGWCYIPELKTRQKFLVTDVHDQFMLMEEPWEGLIPLPENSEKVTRCLLSATPRVWLEENQYFSDVYVEQTSTQSKNKKSRARQPE